MDKLTYEQRVEQMAEKMAYIKYPGYKNSGHELPQTEILKYEEGAKIAVSAQAQAIREQLQPYRSNGFIDKLLIDNGYLPAPEVKDNIANFLDGKDINLPENEQK